MAEPTNGLQQMAVMMLNPQLAVQQQKFALQQQMAQKMMEEGAQQPPDNQLANPGGMVIKNSPIGGAARSVQQMLGAYMMQKGLENQANYYQNMGVSNQSQDPKAPSMEDKLNALLYGDKLGTAGYETRVAGSKKAAEVGATPYQTPQGTYVMGNQLNGVQAKPTSSPSVLPAPQAQMANDTPPPSDKILPTDNAMPNVTANTPKTTDAMPFISSDNKPILSDMPKNYVAPKRAIGDYGGENTTSGVDAQKKMFEDDQKSYGFLSSNAASTRESQGRLNELSDIYEKAQSGTATALFPELAKRFAAVTGVEPKDLGELQAAAGTSLMSNISAIKEANSNQEGAPVRTFGPEISHSIEDYLSNKNQPDALWKLVTQMKGINNYKLSMAQDYEKIGNMGNSILNGKTMPLKTFSNQWQSEHSLSDSIAKTRQETPVFKGMVGNTPPDANDIAHLKSNPQKAALFDKAFGAGSSQQYLTPSAQGWK